MTAPHELWIVARRLGELAERVVFVGGMVRELLVTDPAAGAARVTFDVDCIVGATRSEYARLGELLRTRGFSECVEEGAPLCRWVVEGVRVDIMPTDPAVLGFSNVWYPSAIEHATRIEGPDGAIRVVDAAHFCATKIAAFRGRSGGDFYHHDMEEFIAIVDTRAELVTELEAAPPDVRDFVAEQVREWLDNATFVESLAGHLTGDAASQARMPILERRLRRIAELGALAARVSQATDETEVRAAGLPFPRPDDHPAATLPAKVFLQSSNLRSATYEATSRKLTIEFHSGGVYAYTGVPEQVFADLLAATSHGRYFSAMIRDRYRYRRLV